MCIEEVGVDVEPVGLECPDDGMTDVISPRRVLNAPTIPLGSKGFPGFCAEVVAAFAALVVGPLGLKGSESWVKRLKKGLTLNLPELYSWKMH